MFRHLIPYTHWTFVIHKAFTGVYCKRRVICTQNPICKCDVVCTVYDACPERYYCGTYIHSVINMHGCYSHFYLLFYNDYICLILIHFITHDVHKDIIQFNNTLHLPLYECFMFMYITLTNLIFCVLCANVHRTNFPGST